MAIPTVTLNWVCHKSGVTAETTLNPRLTVRVSKPHRTETGRAKPSPRGLGRAGLFWMGSPRWSSRIRRHERTGQITGIKTSTYAQSKCTRTHTHVFLVPPCLSQPRHSNVQHRRYWITGQTPNRQLYLQESRLQCPHPHLTGDPPTYLPETIDLRHKIWRLETTVSSFMARANLLTDHL